MFYLIVTLHWWLNNWLMVVKLTRLIDYLTYEKNPEICHTNHLNWVVFFPSPFSISNDFSRLMLLQHLHDSCHCFALIAHPSVSAHHRAQKHTRPKPWRITLNPYFYSIPAVLHQWDLWWDLFRSCACTLCDLWGCAPQSAVSPLMTSAEDASLPSFTVSPQN